MKKSISIGIILLFWFVLWANCQSDLEGVKYGRIIYNWIDATVNGNEIAISRYGVSDSIELPFGFKYNNSKYRYIEISKDGWIGFSKDKYNIEKEWDSLLFQPQLNQIELIIAALPYGKLKAKETRVYMVQTNRYIAVEWIEWCSEQSNGVSKFEIIFSSNGVIKIQYENLSEQIKECDIKLIDYLHGTDKKCEDAHANVVKAPSAYFINEDANSISFANCNFLPYVYCNQPLSQQSTGSFNGNSEYNCSQSQYSGAEKMYIMDITESTNVKIKISNFENRNLDVFLLSACNYMSCIAGGADLISIDNLPQGTYYIVVDGLTSEDNGTFDLQLTCNNLSCTDAIEIPSCNNYILGGDTSSSKAVQSKYGCSLKEYPGKEKIYHFKMNNAGNVYVNINEPGMEAILLSGCNAQFCIKAGKEFEGYGMSAGDYYLIIDSTLSGGSVYTGILDCGSRIDCSNYETITCGETKIGTTGTGSNTSDLYNCSGDRKLSGKERVYLFQNTQLRNISATLSNIDKDLDVIILKACDEGSCVGYGDITASSEMMPPGNYYIIVDGVNGVEGSYELKLECMPAAYKPPYKNCFEAGDDYTKTGFWHVINNPPSIYVPPPVNTFSYYPDFPDLYIACEGSKAYWYGENNTGTFIGPYNPNQGPGTGGTSLSANSGMLITPSIDLTEAEAAKLQFLTWWEIEGVDVDRYDMMYIDLSVNNGPFVNIGKLNPLNDVNGLPPYPYSSDGFNLPITHCLSPLFDLSSYVGNTIKVRFRFQTNDNLYNAFRGWLVDCIEVTGEKIPDPVITSVEPVCDVQPTDILHIYGHNFANNATVSFDGIPASDLSVISSDEIQANIPANLNCPGPISVTVDNPGVGGVATLDDAFMCGSGSCLPVANAGLDKLICNGDSVQIGGNPTAKGGSPPYSYEWVPIAGLDNATVANPIASPTSTTTYTVTVRDAAEQTDSDSVVINVRNVPESSFSSGSPACLGSEMCFSDQSTEEPSAWFWDFGDGLGTSSEQNPCYEYLSVGLYAVKLIASNQCGAGNKFTSNVSVITKPVVDFTSNSPQCKGENGATICFVDASTNNSTSWSWDFGDGVGSSIEKDPCYIYSNIGFYNVTHTASNMCGTGDAIIKSVEVKDKPVANFISQSWSCVNNDIYFQDKSIGNPTNWQWNFGDGHGISSEQNPVYAYDKAGSYVVSLLASNECGWSDLYTSEIEVIDVPKADFTTNSPQCLGNVIIFTDNSSGNPTGWHWDFGDGVGTSDLQNPTYQYQAPGIYEVSLIVFNECGASSVVKKEVKVMKAPIANFSAKSTECIRNSIEFFDTSVGNPETWLWNFGDGVGSSTEQNPVYAYNQPGNYYVSLRVSNSCGTSEPITKMISIGGEPLADFSHDAPKCAGEPVNFTDLSTGNILAWNWEFGDGAGSSNQQNPSYIYTKAGSYLARLIVFNSCGASVPKSLLIDIDGEPIADFSYTTPACQGSVIKFNDLTTGSPNTWQWNFGDGGESNIQNPEHVYQAAGNYNVSLIANNSCGSSEPVIKPILVHTIPKANFTYSSPACAGTAIIFTDTSAGSPLSWEWDFNGDGVVDSTQQNPVYIFDTGGVYNASLKITGVCGTDTIVKQIAVSPPVPQADFSFNQPVCNGFPVNFIDKSTGNPNAWDWDFQNDGTVDSNLQNPSFVYPMDGFYMASLIAYNSCGGSDPHYDQVIVLPCNFDCSTNNVTIHCGDVIQGSSIGGVSNINAYACVQGGIYNGPESNSKHRFPYGQLKDNQNIILTLEADNPDLDIFVLANCEPPTNQNQPVNCVAWGDERAVFAGDKDKRFYVIIDGKNGASGNFTLHVQCYEDQSCTPPVFSGLDSASDIDPCEPDGIKLQWVPVSDWGTGNSGTYSIMRNGIVIASAIPGTASEYIDTHAIPGVLYSYKINALNDACGETDGNNIIKTAMDNYATNIQFAGILTAEDLNACGYSGIMITWDLGSANISGYKIYRSIESDCSNAEEIADVSNTNSYVDLTASEDITYYYYVIAYSECGTYTRGSNACLEAKDVTERAPQFAGLHRAFDIDPCQDSGVKLEWEPVSDWGNGNSGSYTLYRNNYLLASGITNTYFIDTTGENNVEYSYRVIAINDACHIPDNNMIEKNASDELNGSAPISSFKSNAPKCFGQSVKFEDTSLNSPNTWYWDFGDGIGSSTLQNPSYNYATPGIYTVSLTTSNSCGNGTVAQQQIKIDQPAEASFIDDLPKCAGQVVQFTDTSFGLPDAWQWNFGDGSSSSEQNPTHIYNNAGNYEVKLKVSNSCGESAQFKKSITIPSLPIADFVSNTPICLGNNMSFVDTSSGNPISWSWDFGDGIGTSEIQNPVYKYKEAGAYNVSLQVSNICGVSELIQKPVNIVSVPVASFTSDSPKCLGTPIQFTNTSSDNANVFKWDFGDGVGTSIEKNPSYLYSAVGTYTVSLIAANECGTSNVASENVSIINKPIANFTVNTPKCSGEPIEFTDLSQGNPTTWEWDFGDGVGTSSEKNPTYTYANPGTYNVSLRVSNGCGESELMIKPVVISGVPSASFISTAPQCKGNAISFVDTSTPLASAWHWDFGDGSYSEQQNPSHLYASEGLYTVTLIASNGCGDSAPYSKNIEVITKPISDFISNAPQCVNIPVQFTDVSNYYPTSWSWTFGDGIGSSTQQNPSYTYSIEGIYNVSLTATNECGIGNSIIKPVQILSKPIANFSSNSPQCIGTPIQFTDLSTGNPTAWQWDFGDGIGTSTAQNPSYSYSQAGVYKAKLTVSALCGVSEPIQKDIVVQPTPISNFSSDAPKCFGEPIHFIDLSSYNPIAWSWDFGDGIGSSTEKNPTYTYSTAGSYDVLLTATNSCGKGTTYHKQIEILNKPTAMFTHDAPKPIGVAVNFTDLSSNNPTQWNWDFGNGESSAIQNPSYIYSSPGLYTVSLTTANDCGVSSSYSTVIEITGAVPAANFVSNEPKCLGDSVSFWDLSLNNPTAWSWNFGDGVGSSTLQNPTYIYSSPGTYQVSLTAYNNVGASTPATKPVHINSSAPISSFTHNAPQCLGTEISFNDTSTGQPLYWNWNFGDGFFSNQQNPSHKYAKAGLYNASLRTSNGCGTGSLFESEVLITGASFDSDSPKCIGESIHFTDKSIGTVSLYQWDFGDGSPMSNDQNPIHTYSTAGEYTVTLTTLGNCPQSSSYSDKVIVNNQAPIANFESSSPNCSSLTIQFYDQSINNPLDWQWNFGDGSEISHEQNPLHTFPSSGTYNVSLKVANGCGESNIITKQITVYSNAAVKAKFTSPDNVCFGTPVQFTDQSLGNPTSYLWNFGDGSTSTLKNPSHNYSAAGKFTVSLTVQNDCSSDSIQKEIIVSVSSIQVDFIAQQEACQDAPVQFTDTTVGGVNYWRWNFGDGSPYVYEKNPTHIFAEPGTYNVSLFAQNACNTSGTKIKAIKILSNTPVVSDFISDAPQCTGINVHFTDTSTGNPTAWQWDFGDGIGTSSAKNPNYAYLQPGIYTVTLNASNNACSNSIPKSKEIQIISSEINANFLSDEAACVGNQINFTDITAGFPEKWLWDFGDGSSSVLQNPTHIYNSPGNYLVSLTVVNKCSGFSQSSKYIEVSNAIPQAIFSFPTPVCVGKPVQFHDYSTNNPTAWLWNFGDGFTSKVQNPVHTYSSQGSYWVSLIASNGCGQSSPTTNILTAFEDIMPQAVSNSFKLIKYNNTDLKGTWQNLPANSTGVYQIVALEYPSIPTPDNMANAPIIATSDSGTTGAIINNALPNPAKIIYYKVRGTGVCSGSPGPL